MCVLHAQMVFFYTMEVATRLALLVTLPIRPITHAENVTIHARNAFLDNVYNVRHLLIFIKKLVLSHALLTDRMKKEGIAQTVLE